MQIVRIELAENSVVRFAGELVAEVASPGDPELPASGGAPARGTVLALYRTAGGQYVCHRVCGPGRPGHGARVTARACETLSEVRRFFGAGRLARELYARAGVDDPMVVDGS